MYREHTRSQSDKNKCDSKLIKQTESKRTATNHTTNFHKDMHQDENSRSFLRGADIV